MNEAHEIKLVEKFMKKKRAKFKVTDNSKTELILIITQSVIHLHFLSEQVKKSKLTNMKKRVSVSTYKYLLFEQNLCNMKMSKNIHVSFL